MVVLVLIIHRSRPDFCSTEVYQRKGYAVRDLRLVSGQMAHPLGHLCCVVSFPATSTDIGWYLIDYNDPFPRTVIFPYLPKA
jgi:hypothetical protein